MKSPATALDLLQDIGRSCGPNERLRVTVMFADVRFDGSDQRIDAPKNATSDGLLVISRKNRSTMLSHDELVGIKCTWKRGWRSLEPSLHFGMLVCGIIVDDEMDIERLVDALVDQTKKL